MKKSVKILMTASLVANVALCSFVAYGMGGKEKIEAWLNRDITMTFNDEEFIPTEADGTQRVPITYEDRTYVPARFVAEKLGAFVDWDEETETVIIRAKYNAMTGEPLEQEVKIEVPATQVGTITKDTEITPDNILTKEFVESILTDGVSITPDVEGGDYDAWNDDGTLKIYEQKGNGVNSTHTETIPFTVESDEAGLACIEALKNRLEEQGFEVTYELASITTYQKWLDDENGMQVTINHALGLKGLENEGIVIGVSKLTAGEIYVNMD